MNEDQVYVSFGKNLRRHREAAKMSQQDFAERAQFSRTSISNIETGRQRILLHHIYQFADILNVPFQAFLPDQPAKRNVVSLYNLNTEEFDEEQIAFAHMITA